MVNQSESELMREIASGSLQCMELVCNNASHELKNDRGITPSVFADINSFVDISLMNHMRNVNEEKRRALQILVNKPIICRVDYVTDSGDSKIYYISPVSYTTESNVISYRAPLGRIASLRAGDYSDINLPGCVDFC